MKPTMKTVLTVFVLSLFLVSESVVAQTNSSQRKDSTRYNSRGIAWQQGNRMNADRIRADFRGNAIPNLTEEQRGQIKALKTDERKELLAVNNRIREQNARLRTLTTANKYDTKAVDKAVDELSKLEKTKLSTSLKYKQQIRELLTDEQRLAFDTRSQRMTSRKYPHKMKNRNFGRHR